MGGWCETCTQAGVRLRHVLTLPMFLSASRAPLGAAFAWVVNDEALALSVLAVAGVTDVLDGYIARKTGTASPTGALVDGVADKIFGAAVLCALVVGDKLSVPLALALAARELLELPLAIRILATRGTVLAKVEGGANRLGKTATLLEFASVAAAIVELPGRAALIVATAVLGVVAALSYWRRELGAKRSPSALGLPADDAFVDRSLGSSTPGRHALGGRLRVGTGV